jgi:hypothetical protein
MKLVDQIEKLLEERAMTTFNKVTVVLNVAVRKALEKELYKNVESFYTSIGQVSIEPTTSNDRWIYFTFYHDYNLVDFLTIDEDELHFPNSDQEFHSIEEKSKPVCFHQWITTRGLFKEYKDCKLCGAKWEDIFKK